MDASAGYTEVSLDLAGLNYVQPAALQAALNSTTAPFLVGQQNTASVNASVAPVITTTDTSKLSFVHLGTNGSVAELPGGPLAEDFGLEYFDRKQDTVAPATGCGALESVAASAGRDRYVPSTWA